MTHQQFNGAVFVRKYTSLALLVGVLCAVAAFVVIMMSAPRTLARMDFLIVQNTQTTDFYALFKSSEFLSEMLVDAVHTEAFIERVQQTPAGQVLTLPTDAQKQLEAWGKMVEVSQRHKLGRLEVVVYGNDAQRTRMIANGVADVLIQQNLAFRGGKAEDMEVRMLTGPVMEENPSMRSLVALCGLSFVFGLALVFVPAYVRAQMRGTIGGSARTVHASRTSKSLVTFTDDEAHGGAQWDDSFEKIAHKLNRLQSESEKKSE